MKNLAKPNFKNILGKGERASIEHISSDFVSIASHQLRTPLSAVKWNTELLLKQTFGRLNAKQQQYLREIYQSNERAISLVNDLLDVSHIQEGEIHLELRPTRLVDIIEETVENFSALIKARRLKVDFQVINGPLPKVLTDPEKLKRVIMNLLSNAIKYTLPEGKIGIVLEKLDHHVRISIADTGVGIAKTDQRKIFKKFFRSSRVLKLSPDGTGLGLFIAKSLMEAMKGRISFRSVENKGSTFSIMIPAKKIIK